MKSRTTIKFRKAFSKLLASVQKQARTAYRLFKKNPNHPSLRFKKVHQRLPIYSAPTLKDYRAIGQLDGETVTWFWIGRILIMRNCYLICKNLAIVLS